jgi:hypothetical protein
VAGTGVFTVASGDPVADGVAVGDFASVYADGSSETGFVGRVTARTTTTITVSLTAKIGTAPVNGTSNRTAKIGGAWEGPNGTSRWPLVGIDAGGQQNAAGGVVRINFKSDKTYSTTSNLNVNGGPTHTWIAGYTTTYGDGGLAKFDGGTTGASFILFTSQNNVVIDSIEFCNNGATGVANGVTGSAASVFWRCSFHDFRGWCTAITNTIECCVYAGNKSNTGLGGSLYNSGGQIIRNIYHSNTGFGASANLDGTVIKDCIFANNTSSGLSALQSGDYLRCDFYNNSGTGLAIGGSNRRSVIDSCNFVKNGGWGVTCGSAGWARALLLNCGFGTGTQINTSGTVSFNAGGLEVGSVSYASDVTPWTDPANGDFRISLAASKGAARGYFRQTLSGYAGTVGYPDIGAAQSQASGSSGIPIARGMHGGMR